MHKCKKSYSFILFLRVLSFNHPYPQAVQSYVRYPCSTARIAMQETVQIPSGSYLYPLAYRQEIPLHLRQKTSFLADNGKKTISLQEN